MRKILSLKTRLLYSIDNTIDHINLLFTSRKEYDCNVQFSHISFRSYTLTIFSYYLLYYYSGCLLYKKETLYISLLMTKL